MNPGAHAPQRPPDLCDPLTSLFRFCDGLCRWRRSSRRRRFRLGRSRHGYSRRSRRWRGCCSRHRRRGGPRQRLRPPKRCGDVVSTRPCAAVLGLQSIRLGAHGLHRQRQRVLLQRSEVRRVNSPTGVAAPGVCVGRTVDEHVHDVVGDLAGELNKGVGHGSETHARVQAQKPFLTCSLSNSYVSSMVLSTMASTA